MQQAYHKLRAAAKT